jgi:ribokinase
VTASVPTLSGVDAEGLAAAAASMRVLVIGSLNVDLILIADREPGDDGAAVVRTRSVQPGGHAGNCAAALAALGVLVAVAGAVGADADGDRVLADLRGRGIDVTGVRRRDDQPTGQVVIPVFGERHYMLLCRGANEAFGAAELMATLSGGEYDAVMLFDPAREALRCAGAALDRTARRPRLYWTPGVFAADPVAAEVLPQCDLVFVNRSECRALAAFARPEPATDLVVTLGAAGSQLRSGGTELTVPARPTRVVDPTGAGDAFASAYLVAELAGLAPELRLALGNACGASAVGVTGARSRSATLPDLLSGHVT